MHTNGMVTASEISALSRTSAGEIWGNFELSQSVFMSNVQRKKFRILIRLPGKLKYLFHNIYLHSKMSPALTALSTTDTYRFYFVYRQKILLFKGNPLGVKGLNPYSYPFTVN